MNSQENTGEEGEAGHRGLCQIKDSPDIINPYSEYAKGFYDGLIQEQQRIVKIIADEINNEKRANENKVIRKWTYDQELMLILSKILDTDENENKNRF